MSKSSPGPWYWNVNAADYLELRTAGDGNPTIGQWGEWPPLSKADAALIVAAPRMLDKLRELAGHSLVDEDGEIAALVAEIDGAG